MNASVDAVVEEPATGDAVVRFDGAERALHWVNAVVVLTLIATGSVMYIGSLSALVGRRELVEQIHLWSGLALPVPFVLAAIGPWGRGVRRDAARLGRFLPDDWFWLWRRFRDTDRVRVGKFNGGQKVNAVLVAGTLPVMLATGVLLEWNTFLDDAYRTGATFVHDWGYVALSLLVAGHIVKALTEPAALRAMISGRMSRRHVADHHPRWHEELRAAEGPDGTTRD